MTYLVRLQPAAVEDLDEAFKYAAKHAPETAERWLQRFQSHIARDLSHHPERCQLAIEDRKSNRTLHQYLFGKRRNVHRVIYTIENQTVWVLRIRRAQRRPLTRRQLGEMNQ